MEKPEPYREEKPWGNFVRYTHNEQTTVKIITVTAGNRFSLQTHAHRSEFWKILEGTPLVTVGTQTLAAKKGDEFFIPDNTEHRLEATDYDVVFLEIAYGDFDESDITRLADDFGRT